MLSLLGSRPRSYVRAHARPERDRLGPRELGGTGLRKSLLWG